MNNKIIYIDPSKVEYLAEDIFYDINSPESRIESGDWDIQNLKKIEDFIIYKSLKDLFIHNKKWQDTELYDFIKKQIDSDDFRWTWNCYTIDQLDKRGSYLCDLYESIKKYGMFEHTESIDNEFIQHLSNIQNDDIMIAIDRNGLPMFVQNGSHRLCIAKILNLKTIPVKVYVRHKEWIDKKEFIYDRCKRLWNGKTYHNLPHPDLNEIESIWSDERYETFKLNSSLQTGTLIDIGSLFGYIPYRAELDGFESTACEIDNNYLEVMKILKKGYSMDYKILENNFLNLNANYDVIIAFNIFHHYLKTESLFNDLTAFLQRSNFKEMFVQFHEQGESQMIGVFKDFSPEEFAQYIMKCTNRKNCEEVGEEMNRKIYKIY